MTHAGALDVTEFVERGEAALDAAHGHVHVHGHGMDMDMTCTCT